VLCAAAAVCLRAVFAPAAATGMADSETAIASASAAASRRIIFLFFMMFLPLPSCADVAFCVGPTLLLCLSIAQFLFHHKILFPIFTIHSLDFHCAV
jgi:hypothetical protein